MSKDPPKPTAKPGAAGAHTRRPSPFRETRTEPKQTGRVQFDDRGNAIWEWSVATGKFGQEVSTAAAAEAGAPSPVACRGRADSVRSGQAPIRSAR